MAVPKLRFKADDGSNYPEWEEKKLSDVFVERRELQCIDDEYKLLSFTIEQGIINPEDKKTNKRDFLMKDKASKKFLRTEYNDIIYNPANLKYGAINRNKLGKGLLSPIYAIFYTDQNAVFMELVVRNPDFIKRSLKYLEGTVIKLMTLKPRDFLRIKSYIPCLPEQQKIVEFLSTIDTVIEKQRETVSAWEERKKGVMQKLFSQEVRFKADDGSDFPDWEEKKIGELGTFIKGAALSKADISESGSPLILYGELYTTYKEVAYNIQRKTQAVVDKKYYSCVGDVIIPTSGESAEEISTATCVMVSDVILGGDLNIFRSDIVDGRIMSYILNHQAKWKIATIAQGKSIVHIQAKQLANICVKYPLSKVEQQKIADCLSSLDEVIEKQKATLSAWEELKKGLLQQMFV